jgi:hypothetical protein
VGPERAFCSEAIASSRARSTASSFFTSSCFCTSCWMLVDLALELVVLLVLRDRARTPCSSGRTGTRQTSSTSAASTKSSHFWPPPPLGCGGAGGPGRCFCGRRLIRITAVAPCSLRIARPSATQSCAALDWRSCGFTSLASTAMLLERGDELHPTRDLRAIAFVSCGQIRRPAGEEDAVHLGLPAGRVEEVEAALDLAGDASRTPSR